MLALLDWLLAREDEREAAAGTVASQVSGATERGAG